MAKVVITLRIMPDSPETDLEKIQEQAEKKVNDFGAEVGKVEIEPVAFGLKSINILFVMEEELGSTDELEKGITEIEGVTSAEVTDVRRAIG
jgi:elongation factor 1-beta